MERTVVHILSASLNYQSFVLHLITCLIETDLSWDFIGQGQNNDLHAIRRTKSRLGKTRMYILTRASEYKVLSIRVGHSASSEDWSHIRICFGTESEPVGYSEGTHYLWRRGPTSFILFFEVPRIAVPIQHHASWNQLHLWDFWGNWRWWWAWLKPSVGEEESQWATVEKQQCSSFQIRWVLKCFVNIFIPSSLELTTHLFGLAKNRDLFVIKKIHHWTHLCYNDSCFGWEHPVE